MSSMKTGSRAILQLNQNFEKILILYERQLSHDNNNNQRNTSRNDNSNKNEF